MKTKMFTLILGLLFFGSNSFAKIFRVGYTGTPLAGVDYTFQDAVSNASAGDTIQIYDGGGGVSGSVDKKLVILGFGFNLDVHPGLQVLNSDQPSYASIYLKSGSDGTFISGITGIFSIGENYSSGTLSNITIERCNATVQISDYISGYAVKDIYINRCVVSFSLTHAPPYSQPVKNLQLNNCIINGEISLYDPGTTAFITNCVTLNGAGSYLNLRDAQVLVKNCIIYSHDYYNTNTNTIYENNFFGESQPNPLPPGSNNRWGQDWTTIFNRLGGTDDLPGYPGQTVFDENYYLLKSGSPAKNGGFDANNNPTDCGIFGGEAAYKYIVSGIPPIPAIYQLTPPADPKVTTNPYNVTISVRSNN
ncbi:MAG TPA: hypothetical protein PLM81_03785 [Ginsengibacter sp.]|nr:hypothetical protein [Ginsengibacter sp.]HRP44896.1 hypothetical protein [Ginsengibacter sp.]